MCTHRAVLILPIAMLACASDPASSAPVDPEPQAPPVPTQVQAIGSLRNIHLRWTASAGATGYHIYRGTDGAELTRLTGDPVAATSYDDPIASPDGDGVYYSYRVTAVGALESAPSSQVRTMHGTRLAAMYTSELDTDPKLSPYVAEGTTILRDGVFLTTKLYALPGAVLDFEVDGDAFPLPVFRISFGLLRAIGTAAAPVRITAHQRGGGVIIDGRGLDFAFGSSVPYNPSDGSGSVLDHVEISHLALLPARPSERGSMVISGTGLKLSHVKISGNDSNQNCRVVVQDHGWVILERSSLDKCGLSIATDVRNTPFQITHNVFRHARSVLLDLVTAPAVGPGQIENNDLNGTNAADTSQVTGTDKVPLGNNYWAGAPGDPPTPSASALFDFASPGPPLAAAPAAGPDW